MAPISPFPVSMLLHLSFHMRFIYTYINYIKWIRWRWRSVSVTPSGTTRKSRKLYSVSADWHRMKTLTPKRVDSYSFLREQSDYQAKRRAQQSNTKLLKVSRQTFPFFRHCKGKEWDDRLIHTGRTLSDMCPTIIPAPHLPTLLPVPPSLPSSPPPKKCLSESVDTHIAPAGVAGGG